MIQYQSINDTEYSLARSKENYNKGCSEDKICWYSIPQYNIDLNGKVITGMIRSNNCKLVIDDCEAKICSSCKSHVKEQSFVKRIQRSNYMQASHGKQTFVTSKLHLGKSIKFLSNIQKVGKLKHYRKLHASQTVKILRLSKQNVRLRASKQKLTDKLGQNAKQGDVSATVCNLNTAYKNGVLHGKSKLLKFISNVSKDLNQKSPRYNEVTQQLYESFRIISGP